MLHGRPQWPPRALAAVICPGWPLQPAVWLGIVLSSSSSTMYKSKRMKPWMMTARRQLSCDMLTRSGARPEFPTLPYNIHTTTAYQSYHRSQVRMLLKCLLSMEELRNPWIMVLLRALGKMLRDRVVSPTPELSAFCGQPLPAQTMDALAQPVHPPTPTPEPAASSTLR